MIIGLCGYAGAGKDALGQILVERHGFVRLAFADAVKAEAIEAGWNGKKDAAGRRMLQEIGMARRAEAEDYWVVQAARQLRAGRSTVITDVRFENEVDFLRCLQGTLVRVTRPGVGPVNDHVSETALDHFTPCYVIENSGTLEDLEAQAVILLAALEGAPVSALLR